MAVSVNWESFEGNCRAPLKGFRADGRLRADPCEFKADPCENYIN